MDIPKTLNEDEQDKILTIFTAVKNTPIKARKSLRNYTIALLMLDAGLRVGETVKLRISDLFIIGEPVQTLRVRAKIAKNKKERIVPMSIRLLLAIKVMSVNFWYAYNMTSNMYAFQSGESKAPPTTRQMERIFRTAGLESIGRPVNPHMFRHTFASRLMRTTNARVVQQLLGHQNLSSTQIYTHPNGDDLKKAIESLTPQEDRP